MLMTSTLFIVLFSIIFMGSTALPLIKVLDRLFPNENDVNNKEDDTSINVNRKILLSKTREMNIMENVELIENDHEHDISRSNQYQHKSILTQLNENFIRPFLIRNLSQEEIRQNQLRLRQMTEAMCIDYTRSFLPTSNPLT